MPNSNLYTVLKTINFQSVKDFRACMVVHKGAHKRLTANVLTEVH